MAEPQSAFNVLRVLRDLMMGGVYSRHTIAKQYGISLVTADRWMRALRDVIPGVRLEKQGKTTWAMYVGARPTSKEVRRGK